MVVLDEGSQCRWVGDEEGHYACMCWQYVHMCWKCICMFGGCRRGIWGCQHEWVRAAQGVRAPCMSLWSWPSLQKVSSCGQCATT